MSKQGKRYLKDYFPDFILDWDDTKNKGVDKSSITVGSSKILIFWKCHKCGFQWSQKVDRRIKHNTGCKICSNKSKLLQYSHPHLYSELDTKNNPGIDLTLLTNGTSRKVWWKCKEGHSWEQSIDTRVKLGSNCKLCKSKIDSFINVRPDLLSEWDYSKNIDLDPTYLTRGSNKKIWWRCSNCGNSFKTELYRRVQGSKCSKCRVRMLKQIPLTTNFSSLLKEWDYKGNSVDPNNIVEGSNQKVSWICSKGHKYKMDPYSRTKLGSGCPFCKGLKIDFSNSLKSLRPDICSEWDYSKNVILPEEVSVYSSRKVWWKCKEGHSWESLISNRTKSKGTNCPICSGRVTTDKTSLFYLFPDLMKEWDSQNLYDPKSLRPGSKNIVSWVCKDNSSHKWKTPVFSRTSKGKFGCPFCSGKKTLRNESLGSKNPKFMDEWDYQRNKIDPFTLSDKSEKKVWWVCRNDTNHFWKTSVSHRTQGTKCPYCSGTNLVLKKYTTLYKLKPNTKITLYYILIFNSVELFYKIGITKNTIEERYKTLFEKTGYKIIKVKVIKGLLSSIVNTEQTIHRKVKRNLDSELVKYKPKKYFGGYSECYEVPQSLLKYRDKIKSKFSKYDSIVSIYKI